MQLQMESQLESTNGLMSDYLLSGKKLKRSKPVEISYKASFNIGIRMEPVYMEARRI